MPSEVGEGGGGCLVVRERCVCVCLLLRTSVVRQKDAGEEKEANCCMDRCSSACLCVFSVARRPSRGRIRTVTGWDVERCSLSCRVRTVL